MQNTALGLRQVHCRTGSLEKRAVQHTRLITVHCRTGSLEILMEKPLSLIVVHCRTGSLETTGVMYEWKDKSSLPHRQLRKTP